MTDWTYNDWKGNPVAVVVRHDLPTPNGEKQRKTFRPVSKHAGGWRWGDAPGRWPLYRLLELADAKRLYGCEGEKSAEGAASIGLTATCSAHGANSAGKTDWSGLAGREVIVLPDNDPAGRTYADQVLAILSKLNPAPVIKLVDLPDLPPGGQPYRIPLATSRQDILDRFDRNVASAPAAIAAASDEQLINPWSLLKGGPDDLHDASPRRASPYGPQSQYASPRPALCLPRLNDVPVPALYGPSADRQGM